MAKNFSVAVVGNNGFTHATEGNEGNETFKSDRPSKRSLFLCYLLSGMCYRVSFIPSGISGGGALMRLWLLP